MNIYSHRSGQNASQSHQRYSTKRSCYRHYSPVGAIINQLNLLEQVAIEHSVIYTDFVNLSDSALKAIIFISYSAYSTDKYRLSEIMIYILSQGVQHICRQSLHIKNY